MPHTLLRSVCDSVIDCVFFRRDNVLILKFGSIMRLRRAFGNFIHYCVKEEFYAIRGTQNSRSGILWY